MEDGKVTVNFLLSSIAETLKSASYAVIPLTAPIFTYHAGRIKCYEKVCWKQEQQNTNDVSECYAVSFVPIYIVRFQSLFSSLPDY